MSTINRNISILKKATSSALFILTAIIFPLLFTSCQIDGDAPIGGGGGSSSSVSSSDLKGRTFKKHYIGDPNDEGYSAEGYDVITFTSTSSCTINTYGFDWIWDDGYRKSRYDKTSSCRYSVSGSKITLHDYPFYAFGGDLKLTYYGDFLSDGYDIYYEQ